MHALIPIFIQFACIQGVGGMNYNGEKWEESADVEDNTHTIKEKTE